MEPLKWTTEKRRLGELVKWKDNPKELTEEQGERLRESLLKFGYSQLYEIEPDNQILDGHQRDEIMLRMAEFGPDAEIEVRVSSRKLTDEERRKYVVYKQKAAGQWDLEKLKSINDLEDLKAWGFTDEELELKEAEEKLEMEILLDQGVQMKPPMEYVLIICKDSEEWERLREIFNLGLVRRGGYKKGSPFDQVGVERVVKAAELIGMVENVNCNA